jgi:ATP/maltotriose-dependent transcriptional regulator MalT
MTVPPFNPLHVPNQAPGAAGNQPAPFVGREHELARARAALDAAASGHGSLIMLVGEPGVGKTTLCEHFLEYAARRQALTLIGRCSDSGGPSVPYLAFSEAIGEYANHCDLTTLHTDVGVDVVEAARITPQLRAALQVEIPTEKDLASEERRYRLLQGVTTFLRRLASSSPVVLVLDDLHDADRGTLDLLLHLTRSLSRSRLLVVGTYRDTEVDRVHPLSATLAEMRRIAGFDRLPLQGLDEGEVCDLLRELHVDGVTTDLARAVHRRTEGNALFVREVARTLLQETGASASAVPPMDVIPEGLRDVIGKRLSRLSATANDILRVAAVIGREFRLDLLVRVMPLAEEDIVAGLEEACRVSLIEERLSSQVIVTYRFRHLLFRQTLNEELSAPRRLRWHHLIGTALEDAYSGHLADHAAELAEHFSQSSNVPDLEKAVAYSERAADRAMRVYAYSEAAHHLERALDIHELVDPDGASKRCDLLLGFGAALVLAGAVQRAVQDVAPAAHRLAMALGDGHRAFRACTIALDALQAMGGASAETRPDWLQWAERADTYAQPATTERVRADIALAAARSVRGRGDEALELGWRALDLARKLKDPQAMWEAAFRVFHWTVPDQWSKQVDLAREFSTLPRDGVSARAVGNTLHWCALVMLADGDRDAFARLDRASRDIHADRYAAGAYWRPGWDSIDCELDGQLGEAIALCEQGIQRGAEVHSEVLSLSQAIFHMRKPLFYLGQVERYIDVVQVYVSAAAPPRAMAPLMLASALAELGRIQESHAAAESLPGASTEHGTIRDLVLRLELANAWHDAPAAEALATQLAPVAHLAAVDSMPNIARLIGTAAVLRGDVASARTHFELAVERTRQIRFRPELALSRLHLAELLLEHFPNESPRALEHLHAAAAEFEAMDMRPALARAQHYLDLVSSGAVANRSRPLPGGLTARECEVAAMLGAGVSNREIAHALVISDATVGVHVKHILSKLEFKSRAQVAVWAAEHGLVQRS